MEGLEDIDDEDLVHVVHAAAEATVMTEEELETDRRFNEVLAIVRHRLRTGKGPRLYNALAKAYERFEEKEDPPLLR